MTNQLLVNQMPLESHTTVQNVARYFLSKSKIGTDKAITHLKLQKLVYYAQAWFLANTNGQLLFNSPIEAWIHGPVCPELYNEYRNHGYHEILPEDPPENLEDNVGEILDAVWEVYGSYDGKFLEELTHSEQPWINARMDLPPNAYGRDEIRIEDMIEYYGNQT